jgi:HK97 family phage major capsid protein
MDEQTHDFVPEVEDEEKKKRQRSGILSIVDAIVGQKEQEWTEDMATELEKWRKPDRASVPKVYEDPADHRGNLHVSSPTDRVYSRMPEEVRAIRNPDSDHWMAEELRGIAFSDRARIFQARANLGNMFGRATTTEGVAAASGAYSTGTGGTLISRPMEALVLISRDKVSKMPRFSSSFTMTKQTHTVPTAAAMTSYQTLEGGTTTQGEPTYSAVQLTATKGAARGIVTLEMLDDADVNLVGTMTTRAGMSLGALQEAQFWRTGNGTAPNISAFAAGTAYAETTSGTLDFTSVIGMYYTLSEPYVDAAAWYAEKSVLQLMMLVRDANGRAFYQGLNERPAAIDDHPGAVGTILGHPVYRVDATAGTIHFGDMNALYLVGQRQGITARMSEHVGFATGTVQFIWEQRYDGQNVDLLAVQTCTGITAANSL